LSVFFLGHFVYIIITLSKYGKIYHAALSAQMIDSVRGRNQYKDVLVLVILLKHIGSGLSYLCTVLLSILVTAVNNSTTPWAL